ncbi:putative ribonuclease H-like domain-containing protein [Tanacetum coccineum]
MVNTGKREGKLVWDNSKRVNHPNFSKYPHLSKTFVPAGVSSRTGLHRPSINTARSVCTTRPSINTTRPVSTVRPSISTARPSISTVRPVYASRSIYPRMDNVRPRGSCSPIKRSYYIKPAFRPKDLKQDVKTFGVKNMTTAGKRALVNTGKGKLDTDLKESRWVWRPNGNYLDHVSKDSGSFMLKKGNPEILLQDHAVVNSSCSSHMTGNKAYLSDYEDFNGGFVAFRSHPKGGKITGKCSSEKDKGLTQEYILLPLQPHRTRIPVEDVPPTAHEKYSKKEKRRIASQKKAAQATSTNKLSTDRPSVSTDRPYVSTDRPFVSTDRSNTPYASAASTPTGANAGESSFVYLGGKIPIDASTLPNADLPIDPNMPDLEDASDTLPNDGIFNGAYDDDEDVGAVADFNNMDNTIAVSPIPTLRIHKDHPKGQILGDPTSAVQTRGKIQKASSAQQALVIGTKWVFKNKRDERSIVVKNKARLVAQGFRQDKGIDYDEVFVPVARIKAIRLFLAFASYMGFTVYQMDVKSAFLYGTIEEEVAWYETLSSFLMENGFRRGTIDKTLFIKKKKSDIMLVQVYVDDIIFGSTKKSMCTEFEECMHKRFQMSSMGELTFFLGLQVKQQPDGIFISQDKYVADILKKFDFLSIRTAITPIESNKPLVKDEDGVDVDVHVYRSMIGSLMYLTASRPDIMFAVCAYARF